MELSKREKEVLSLIAEGRPDKEIAVILRISRRTVQTHMRRIFAKLQVNNRVRAVAVFYDYNIRRA